MLVEMRTYNLQIGKMADYFKLYEAEALAVQKRILGRLVGYYRTEIGELNQIVHMWGYTDLNERNERRTALFKDSAWLAYLEKARPFFEKQHSQILVPAPFFKPTWME